MRYFKKYLSINLTIAHVIGVIIFFTKDHTGKIYLFCNKLAQQIIIKSKVSLLLEKVANQKPWKFPTIWLVLIGTYVMFPFWIEKIKQPTNIK